MITTKTEKKPTQQDKTEKFYTMLRNLKEKKIAGRVLIFLDGGIVSGFEVTEKY
jgi:hypothetical protein